MADAFALAQRLHRHQSRKGSDIPYITHLMAVAALVGEHGGDEDQVIAALLHDAVEDQGGHATLAQIRGAFGDAVADYVAACSDAYGHPKPPWQARKQRFLDEVAHAPPEVRLIVAADKLHNARAILRDLHTVGNTVWERFTGGREATLWYCREVVRALADGWSHPILQELCAAEDELQRLADEVKYARQPPASRIE